MKDDVQRVLLQVYTLNSHLNPIISGYTALFGHISR